MILGRPDTRTGQCCIITTLMTIMIDNDSNIDDSQAIILWGYFKEIAVFEDTFGFGIARHALPLTGRSTSESYRLCLPICHLKFSPVVPLL